MTNIMNREGWTYNSNGTIRTNDVNDEVVSWMVESNMDFTEACEHIEIHNAEDASQADCEALAEYYINECAWN